MKQRKTVKQVREELKEKEENIWGDIDLEAKNLNEKIKNGVKSAAIVGGTVLIGYTITRLLTSSNKQPQKQIKTKSTKNKELGLKVTSLVIKTLLPIAISTISKQMNSTDS